MTVMNKARERRKGGVPCPVKVKPAETVQIQRKKDQSHRLFVALLGFDVLFILKNASHPLFSSTSKANRIRSRILFISSTSPLHSFSLVQQQLHPSSL